MKTPTPEAIRAFVKKHGLTGAQAAELAGLSGGQAFRKYAGGTKPHKMSEAMWFTLHARVMLPAAILETIHREMALSASLPAEIDHRQSI